MVHRLGLGRDGVGPTPLRRSGGTRLAVLLLAALLLVVIVVGWMVERRVRAVERSALASCDVAARTATEQAETGLATIRAQVSPAVYRSPPADGEALFGQVARLAEVVRAPVVAALRRCESVEVVAWHPGTGAERANVVAFLATYDRWLGAIAGDGEAIDAEPATLGDLRRRAFPDPGS